MKLQVSDKLAVIVLILSLVVAKPVSTKPNPDARIEAQQLLQRKIEKAFGNEEWFDKLNAFITKCFQEEEKVLINPSRSPASRPTTTASSVFKPINPKPTKPMVFAVSTKKPASKPETAPKTDKPLTHKPSKTVPPVTAKPTKILPLKSTKPAAAK